MDTGGKDGTIKHVFGGVNPQGCQVSAVQGAERRGAGARLPVALPRKAPDARHDRHLQPLALRGRAGGAGARPGAGDVWKARYEQINDFERIWSLNDTVVLKFYLHISKDEQKRAAARPASTTPDKRWKFRSGDLAERALWDDYMAAYEDACQQMLHRVRALVRGAGRPEMVPQPRGRARYHRHARSHEPAVSPPEENLDKIYRFRLAVITLPV